MKEFDTLPIRRNDRRDADAPRLFTTHAKHEALLALNKAVNEYAEAFRDLEHKRERMMQAQLLVDVTF